MNMMTTMTMMTDWLAACWSCRCLMSTRPWRGRSIFNIILIDTASNHAAQWTYCTTVHRCRRPTPCTVPRFNHVASSDV